MAPADPVLRQRQLAEERAFGSALPPVAYHLLSVAGGGTEVMFLGSQDRAPRLVPRLEAGILIGVSLMGHTALAFQVARSKRVAEPVVAPVVSVELVRPAPVVPPAIPPREEPPKAKPVSVRRAPPPAPARVKPSPAPTPPAAEEPPHEEPGPVPEGDDPNSRSGGHGTALPGPASPAAPPASPAPPVAPAAMVAAQEGANYLKNPRPGYPSIALRRGWQGDVQLRVRVSPEGKPLSIVVQRSSGREVLDQAAVEAVKGWTFNPARQGGLPVAGWVTVPIVFRLQQGE